MSISSLRTNTRKDGTIEFYEMYPDPRIDGALTPRAFGIFFDGKPVKAVLFEKDGVNLLKFHAENMEVTFQLRAKG